jgi:putative membrane protein
MRSEGRVGSLLTYLSIMLFNVYTLILYFNEQLILYIHPRYVMFTVFFNVLSLVVCGAGLGLAAWRMRSGVGALRLAWRPPLTVLVAGLVLAAAYALPARTLSSDTADQRSANFNDTEVQQPSGGTANTLALFEVDTAQLGIPDWVSAFNMKTSASFFEGKKADVVGFVFHPEGTPQDVFYVSRFRLTCCAVDAQPLGVPVYSPGWQEEYKKDSWVHVTGTFSKTDEDIAEPAIITPESIEPTDQPENPYVT